MGKSEADLLQDLNDGGLVVTIEMRIGDEIWKKGFTIYDIKNKQVEDSQEIIRKNTKDAGIMMAIALFRDDIAKKFKSDDLVD